MIELSEEIIEKFNQLYPLFAFSKFLSINTGIAIKKFQSCQTSLCVLFSV